MRTVPGGHAGSIPLLSDVIVNVLTTPPDVTVKTRER